MSGFACRSLDMGSLSYARGLARCMGAVAIARLRMPLSADGLRSGSSQCESAISPAYAAWCLVMPTAHRVDESQGVGDSPSGRRFDSWTGTTLCGSCVSRAYTVESYNHSTIIRAVPQLCYIIIQEGRRSCVRLLRTSTDHPETTD